MPESPWPIRVDDLLFREAGEPDLEAAGMRRERLELAALWRRELGWLDEVGDALLDEEWREAQRRRGSSSRSA